jgi:hypothetical protein
MWDPLFFVLVFSEDSPGNLKGFGPWSVGFLEICPDMKNMKQIQFTYRFIFADGHVREHAVTLAAETGRLVSAPSFAPPAWTNLDHEKCANCPLKSAEHPVCPVAHNLAAVAEDFKSEKSYEKIVVEVIAPERVYRKELQLQEGLFGLFGLIMATSDCPFLHFLRPMARFHLPFSSFTETMARSVSFYLLKQYFHAKKGEPADFELLSFGQRYKDLEAVNMGMLKRIRSISKADADMNSIIILDSLGKMLSGQVSRGLQDLESLFAS